MVIEYIPEKWRNLRLEYTDEYLNYHKEKKLKKESIHEPKIMKKPGKIIVNNPIKQPDSILNFKGYHTYLLKQNKEYKNILANKYIYNIPYKNYKNYKVKDCYYYNENLKNKVYNFYKRDFEFAKHFNVDYTIKDYINSSQNKKVITFAALEEVTDPRNIGSIIRSATAFNIDGLIVKERSFPAESKLLYKSASGCMEHINIFNVSNISTTLKFLKEKNFWICGFDNDSEKDFTKHDWEGRNVLLFGSEGYGLKHQTKKNSDFLLKIVIDDKIESLNISNSASVVFHYINKMRKNN